MNDEGYQDLFGQDNISAFLEADYAYINNLNELDIDNGINVNNKMIFKSNIILKKNIQEYNIYYDEPLNNRTYNIVDVGSSGNFIIGNNSGNIIQSLNNIVLSNVLISNVSINSNVYVANTIITQNLESGNIESGNIKCVNLIADEKINSIEILCETIRSDGIYNTLFINTDTLFVNNQVTFGQRLGDDNTDIQFRVKGFVSSFSRWVGTGAFGGINRAVILGEYDNMAWLGGHSGALNQWTNLYINPGGSRTIIGGTFDSGRTLTISGSAYISNNLDVIGDIISANIKSSFGNISIFESDDIKVNNKIITDRADIVNLDSVNIDNANEIKSLLGNIATLESDDIKVNYKIISDRADIVNLDSINIDNANEIKSLLGNITTFKSQDITNSELLETKNFISYQYSQIGYNTGDITQDYILRVKEVSPGTGIRGGIACGGSSGSIIMGQIENRAFISGATASLNGYLPMFISPFGTYIKIGSLDVPIYTLDISGNIRATDNAFFNKDVNVASNITGNFLYIKQSNFEPDIFDRSIIIPDTIYKIQRSIFTNHSDSTGFRGCSMSYSGKYIAFISQNYLYSSSDYGLTWTTTAGIVGRNIGMSSDGKYRITGRLSGAGGLLNISSNFGLTWTNVNGGYNSWQSTSMSGTGQYMLAIPLDIQPRAVLNNNFGVGSSWINPLIDGNLNVIDNQLLNTSINENGQYMMISGSSKLYISSDYGNTFTSKLSGVGIIRYTAINGDGKYMMAMTNNTVYTSSDYGNNWINSTSYTESFLNNFEQCGMSHSGKIQYLTSNRNLLLSTNYGKTFEIKTNNNLCGVICSDKQALFFATAGNVSSTRVNTISLIYPEQEISGLLTINSNTIFNNDVILTNDTRSISSNSGALVVSGGVGIAGDMFISGNINGNIISNNITSENIISNNLNVQNITSNNAVFNYLQVDQTSIFNAISGSHLDFLTGRFSQTTESIDPLSGCLRLGGGLGVVGNINIGGDISGNNLLINNSSIFNGPISGGHLDFTTGRFQGTTPSTSTTTGALRVAGGVGIVGDLNVGNTIKLWSRYAYFGGTAIRTFSSAWQAALHCGFSSSGDTIVLGELNNKATIGGHNLALNGWRELNIQPEVNFNVNIGVAGNQVGVLQTYKPLRVLPTTQSTSTTTGAATISGGLGVVGNCYIGGNLILTSNNNLNVGSNIVALENNYSESSQSVTMTGGGASATITILYTKYRNLVTVEIPPFNMNNTSAANYTSSTNLNFKPTTDNITFCAIVKENGNIQATPGYFVLTIGGSLSLTKIGGAPAGTFGIFNNNGNVNKVSVSFRTT